MCLRKNARIVVCEENVKKGNHDMVPSNCHQYLHSSLIGKCKPLFSRPVVRCSVKGGNDVADDVGHSSYCLVPLSLSLLLVSAFDDDDETNICFGGGNCFLEGVGEMFASVVVVAIDDDIVFGNVSASGCRSGCCCCGCCCCCFLGMVILNRGGGLSLMDDGRLLTLLPSAVLVRCLPPIGSIVDRSMMMVITFCKIRKSVGRGTRRRHKNAQTREWRDPKDWTHRQSRYRYAIKGTFLF